MDKPELNNSRETFEFPPEWQDESRMTVMFSPFRPKTLDSIAWESKLKFWETLIKAYCSFYKKPTFTVPYLKKAFTRNGKSPSCLETVTDQLLQLKTIELTTSYINYSLTPDTLMFWLVNSMVKSPLNWAFSKIKTPFTTLPDVETVSYVYVSVAKDIGEEILITFNDQRGKLILLTTFNEIVGINSEDSLVILKSLIANKKVALSKIGADLVIKVGKIGEKSVVITEMDIGVFQLERNEKVLQDSIDNLDKDVEAAMAKVRSCLKTNRKQMAKSWLRQKKELDKYIEKRACALDNIRSLLEKLRQTESDALVLDSYHLGVAALKKSLSDNGLSEKRAEATVDELKDILDVTNNIEDGMSRPLDASSDADLEQELESLLQVVDDATPGDSSGGSFNVNLLPNVPTTLDESLQERLKFLSVE